MHRAAIVLALLTGAAPGSAQRTITLESAPLPGRTLSLAVEVPDGHPVALLASAHTDRTFAVPGIADPLRLDPSSIGLLQLTGSGAAGVARFRVPLPADPALVGLTIDFQGLDVDPFTGALALTEDEAVVTVVASIPTALFAVSEPGNRGGQVRLVDESRFGGSIPAGGRYEPAALAWLGRRGYVQGWRDAGLSGGAASLGVSARREVTLDSRGSFRLARLPSGCDLTVARDAASPEDWVVLLLDAVQGSVVEVPDSRRTRLPALSGVEFGSPFADWWGFSADGSVACCVVDYATESRPRNTDPFDEVLLIRTDLTPWPGSTSPVRDITFPREQWRDGTLVVANERCFVWNTSGEMWSAPLDGRSILQPVPLPRTRAGSQSVFSIERSFRLSDDGRTLVVPITGSSTRRSDFDLIALTNINTNGFQIANISRLPTAERLEADFGDSRAGVEYFADLAPDGSRFAWITGFGQSAGPHRLWVAPTDSSAAGGLSPIGGFPASAVRMSTPYVFADGSVTVFAGPSSSRLDVYRVLPGATTAQRVTTSEDISILWSLAPFGAAAGNRLVFNERTPGAFGGDLVAIDPGGSLRSLSGSRYGNSGVPSLQVPPDPRDAFLRSDPLNPSVIYLVARPQNRGAVWFDDEVFLAGLDVQVPMLQVTANGGSGPVDRVADIADLALYGAGGSFAHVERRGAAPFAMPVDPQVIGTLANGSRARLDAVDFDAHVEPGSLRVGLRDLAAIWVGTDRFGVRSSVRFAPLDGSAEGWPLRLTGDELLAARFAPLAVDF